MDDDESIRTGSGSRTSLTASSCRRSQKDDMASFKEIRELLLLSFENETINDDEFLLLSEQFKSKNPDFPYENYLGFELDDMDESECLVEFRFQKRHIPLLADVLQLPDQFLCYQRSVSSGIEGLCILLKRLSYPCRYDRSL